ncbi:MAG: hypothetical protein GY775_18790 [Candidatus Scalindua sp.]|nr:hypothetical protein [Candidatus Scalindua sp.]
MAKKQEKSFAKRWKYTQQERDRLVPKKTLDLQYDCKCRIQCSENLSDNERKNSFESFQELDWLSQKQVILKTRKVDSNQFRNYSRVFHIANRGWYVTKT